MALVSLWFESFIKVPSMCSKEHLCALLPYFLAKVAWVFQLPEVQVLFKACCLRHELTDSRPVSGDGPDLGRYGMVLK